MQAQLLQASAMVCWGAPPEDSYSLGACPKTAWDGGAAMPAAPPPGPALGWPPATAAEKWLLPSRCSEAQVWQLPLPRRRAGEVMKTSQLRRSSRWSPRAAGGGFPVRIISSFTSAGAA